jgi:hypothetical protein
LEGVQCELICISRAELKIGSNEPPHLKKSCPELWDRDLKRLSVGKHKAPADPDKEQGDARNVEIECIYKFYNVL